LNNKFSTPSVTELVAIVGGSQETVLKILKILVNNGDIIDLGDGIMMHRKSVELAKGMLIDEITKNGSIETGAFRNKIDTTRKYVVPLLEYCDKVGLTKREGNIRKLI
jgi:selenocysteine-specific elongation factor